MSSSHVTPNCLNGTSYHGPLVTGTSVMGTYRQLRGCGLAAGRRLASPQGPAAFPLVPFNCPGLKTSRNVVQGNRQTDRYLTA